MRTAALICYSETIAFPFNEMPARFLSISAAQDSFRGYVGAASRGLNRDAQDVRISMIEAKRTLLSHIMLIA